ncbi:beta-ketoacyl synthase chain length factor [Halomonas sp. NO4]|uniref:beta-ketoacyl synthase chain length factor n=1 Tax=Halomonas sp. NO4 TaxID=2484813 RepID=UPI0013D2AB11|nr:beta-ketoacyl synthase chain length factor [Halomonas sp. NO4]
MERLCLSDWRGWHGGATRSLPPTQHRLSDFDRPGNSLPGMLRRRLDETGRAVCDILAALDPEARYPLIHASRHGDARHTLAMLEALAAGEPPSPTRFSMSVHNAVLGVHSIAQQHRRPLQALGACGQEFDALLVEATGYLAEGHPSVVIALSEGALPEAYADHVRHPGIPCAVGLRLSRESGSALVATKGSGSGSVDPDPLDVMEWLAGATSVLEGRQRWHLEAP